MKVDLYDCGDILTYAEKIGYFWNQAHDILDKDDVMPSSGVSQFYLSDMTDENNEFNMCYSDDTLKILRGFMAQEGIEEFHLYQ